MQSRLPASHMMRINADESKPQIINKQTNKYIKRIQFHKLVLFQSEIVYLSYHISDNILYVTFNYKTLSLIILT